ncbi:hypothetical protein V5799_009793 [Amblyomma americanum]|uniref:Uncharacterized protein n=1 Tax=Amblyomma americanum TaxID=6943 RepID=A0AAQ4FAP0_AMBAM
MFLLVFDGAMVGINVPVHVFSASTKTVKKPYADVQKRDDVPSQSIEKAVTVDKISRACGEAEPPLQSRVDGERRSIEPDKRSLTAPNTKSRRASSPAAVLIASGGDDAQQKLSPAAETAAGGSVVQQGVVVRGAVFQQRRNERPENSKDDDGPAVAKVSLKDAMVGASSSALTGFKIVNPEPKLEHQHVKADEARVHRKPSDQLSIEQVGELARLLSGLIRKHEKMARSKTVADNTTGKGQRHRKQERGVKNACIARGSELPQRQRAEETSEDRTEVTASDIKQESVAEKTTAPPAQVGSNMADHSEQQMSAARCTNETTITTTEGALNTTATPKPPELPFVKGPPKQSSFSRVKSQEKLTLTRQSSTPLTDIENSADDEKYGSDRIGGKIPQPIPVGVPQDHRGWVPIGAAYAAQAMPDRQAAHGLLLGDTSAARDVSLTFSDVRGSETTPPLTMQKPYQEYMAKQLQPPVHFAERPFADILASLESDMTSLRKDDDDDKDDVQSGKAVNKSPLDSVAQSSTQSGMNDDNNLDEAAINTSSKERSDSGTAAASSDVVEMSGSGKPNAAVSSKVSNDSSEASREVARALLTFCDSDEGSVQPSESTSLSFLSSNSSCNVLHRLTDLVDLPRLERSVATHETGDGVVLSMPPRVTSSSAVQTENSWQPSRSERGAQAHLLPPGRAGLPQLRKARRRDTAARVATDRPWTEDVKKVVMLGNKHYLRQHAARYPVAKSATTFDETQYLLLQIDDQAQPVDSAASRAFLEAPCSMSLSGELTRGSCESTLEALLRRSTVSSLKDIGRSDDNNFEPLKLSELILLQHPAVGLTAVDFAIAWPPLRAAPAHAEHIGGELQIPAESKEAAAGLKDEPAVEKRQHKAAAEPFSVAHEEVHRRRPSLTKSAAKLGVPENRPERERALAKKGAAATRAVEPTVHFAGPLFSQAAVVFSDRSVAIRLPGSVLPATTLPRVGAAIPRSRQLLLARTLEEPSFESIYNAILQPPPQALDPSAPGDVPCSRATSSSRAVSFDDSLTVVPLEPFASAEAADMESPAPSPLHWRQLRARRRSSLCRSLSGSRLHAAESADTARKMRSPRLPSCAASPVPRGSGASRRDMSPFYSFEDTGSELSFPPPDSTSNFRWSGSGPNSQRSNDDERRGQAQGQAAGQRPA